MHLVEILSVVTNIKLDLRYATTNNVTGIVLYNTPKAYLGSDPCAALINVQKNLNSKGYGLLVWDAYRPYSVTKKLWELAPPKNKDLTFADPAKGSIHNKGCAIDVTLFDLNTGLEQVMPSPFDDNTDKARPTYAGVAPDVSLRREILRNAFEDNGFVRDDNEWWHFNWKDHENFKMLDIAIEDIKNRP